MTGGLVTLSQTSQVLDLQTRSLRKETRSSRYVSWIYLDEAKSSTNLGWGSCECVNSSVCWTFFGLGYGTAQHFFTSEHAVGKVIKWLLYKAILKSSLVMCACRFCNTYFGSKRGVPPRQIIKHGKACMYILSCSVCVCFRVLFVSECLWQEMGTCRICPWGSFSLFTPWVSGNVSLCVYG